VASPFEEIFVDPLYGEIRLEPEIADLASRPLVQRLRHIRLSNIDSLSSPGISNITRYEHALGAAVLAANTSFARRSDPRLRNSFIAAALIHDTGITPFGHLMEEAFFYSQVDYHHETKWSVLLERRPGGELGGADLQVYLGQQSGLRAWAERFYGVNAVDLIEEIARGIQGKGCFGAGIAGELDVDNLDNVTRAAFHIGLPVDRVLPLRITECLENITEAGAFFSTNVLELVKEWLALREQVYSRFMLPRADFSGKLMLLFSMVQALKTGLLTKSSWNLTDGELWDLLLRSKQEDIVSATRRWLTSDLWELSDLVWFEGALPPFSALNSYAAELSSALARPCFAYRIKDKRKRRIKLQLTSGRTEVLGQDPTQWLFGVGSPIRKPFTSKENKSVIDLARTTFNAELVLEDEHSRSLFA
jgi:HD superfamily phosphohydrolase